MPPMQLPLIPAGSTQVNNTISVIRRNDCCYYFCGIIPVFLHDADDHNSFRMYTSSLVVQGICRQVEIINAFGVSRNSVSRSVSKYQKYGPSGFFRSRKGHGGTVLTAEVMAKAQELLNLGYSKREAADKLKIKYDTLRKSVYHGRLAANPVSAEPEPSSKSERSAADSSPGMGMACTRQEERVAAAVGFLKDGAIPVFETCLDVPMRGALYIDGHVRVYHGQKTKLPKRYISRQRLCLRGTTDYWVNDALGQPYFVVNRAVDQGLLEALRSDIVPRLLRDIPNQPTEEELKADPFLSRFTLIFDREGYSPGFFREMREKHRIACITYHKFPKDDWPEEWFEDVDVNMPNGEVLTMKLAEMGSLIGSKESESLWVREVRKLNKSGHQSSLISSARDNGSARDAALLFSRWSQENFFGYMMKHFAIDLLSEYGTEDFPGTQRVVNPEWRVQNRELRSLKQKLARRGAKHSELILNQEDDSSKVKKWIAEKAELLDKIQYFKHRIEEIRERISKTPNHLDWHELPEAEKFRRLPPSRKRLTDTIKMIAYRAETSMASIVREKYVRKDNVRALLVSMFQMEADILPDIESGTLTVRLHQMSSRRDNEAIAHLLKHLNETEINYPGTKLRMIYEMIAPEE